ncbi:MAG: hypothetical protein WAV01_00725 [Candidatus Saccharimonadales bacterium]
MSHKQQITDMDPISQLERFSLGFEYNKTLQEVKREVRNRTL